MIVDAVGPNPYIFGPPIRNRQDFYGRVEEIRRLKQCIAQHSCAAVVGERRIGKSSLLLHLQSEPPQSWPENDAPIFVFVDAQLPLRGESDLYAAVIKGLAQQSLAAREALSRLSQEKNEQDLVLCLEQLSPRRVALLIDEFEALCERPVFSAQFFLSLRAIAQNYGLSLVTATSVPLGRCCAKGNAPPVFRNIFQDIRLGPFSEPETRAFIEISSKRSGVPLTRYLPQIVGLGGHFPAFLQIACSCYYEAAARQAKLTTQDQRAIRQRFSEQARSHFESIWQQYLGDNEKAILQQLATGQRVADLLLLQELEHKGYVIGKQIFSIAFADMFTQGKRANDPTLPLVYLDSQDEIWVDGRKLDPPLTRSQHRLLKYLCLNSERICDKDEIASAVWGSTNMDKVDDERIAKLISRLRRRIEPNPRKPCYLLTTHGRGYRLVRQPSEIERDAQHREQNP